MPAAEAHFVRRTTTSSEASLDNAASSATPDIPTAPKPRRRKRWLRRIGLVLLVGLGGGYLYSALTLPPTRVLSVQGRDFDVREYQSHTRTTLILGEQPRVDQYLWLAYYPLSSDTAHIRYENVLLSTALCAVADSLGLTRIKVDALVPIGPRPLRVTLTWTYWYEPRRQGRVCTAAPAFDPRSAPNQRLQRAGAWVTDASLTAGVQVRWMLCAWRAVARR